MRIYEFLHSTKASYTVNVELASNFARILRENARTVPVAPRKGNRLSVREN